MPHAQQCANNRSRRRCQETVTRSPGAGREARRIATTFRHRCSVGAEVGRPQLAHFALARCAAVLPRYRSKPRRTPFRRAPRPPAHRPEAVAGLPTGACRLTARQRARPPNGACSCAACPSRLAHRVEEARSRPRPECRDARAALRIGTVLVLAANPAPSARCSRSWTVLFQAGERRCGEARCAPFGSTKVVRSMRSTRVGASADALEAQQNRVRARPRPEAAPGRSRSRRRSARGSLAFERQSVPGEVDDADPAAGYWSCSAPVGGLHSAPW